MDELRQARVKVRALKIASDRERTRLFGEIDELLGKVAVSRVVEVTGVDVARMGRAAALVGYGTNVEPDIYEAYATRLLDAYAAIGAFACEWCPGDGLGDHSLQCAKRVSHPLDPRLRLRVALDALKDAMAASGHWSQTDADTDLEYVEGRIKNIEKR